MQSADYIICTKVMERQEWKTASTVCLYFSRPDEVDTKPLLAAALTAEKTVAFPRIKGCDLVLHRITSITDFTRGRFGILEPKASCQLVNLSTVDLFIVPGVAFDRQGYRLGHGKGYYDRLLAGIDAPKIGLAYEYQLVAQLPRSSYDVPMTMVVTEK
jgi:5-formyltetrahydrofolate cyclo-ligase